MCGGSPLQHATAVGSVVSTIHHPITSSAGAATSLTPMAHCTHQAGCSRPSACQASRRVARMQVSAVRQQQHACTSTAGVVAHCAAVPHRCPSAGDGVHPALPEHVGSDCSATRGSFSTGIETRAPGKRGLDGQRGRRERKEHARERRVPSFFEVDSLVSRTFARAQTPSRRAWLTAARRAVPGDRPTPSPRPVLTATPDFVPRHRSARRGHAPLRALFCPVRGRNKPDLT